MLSLGLGAHGGLKLAQNTCMHFGSCFAREGNGHYFFWPLNNAQKRQDPVG
jgi:hypothetical protein